ncbi:unnamed protein product, partial [Medioppia subpectinata]
ECIFAAQVSFAGMSCKTSVKKNSCSPVWNEQIVITEMFPPLCQRLKIQIRDSDPVSDHIIATHFIPLSKISNEGSKGFLPTFGPSFIYLYGSIRDGSIFEDQSILNDGFSEGIMYRGRILMAIHTEILESVEANIAGVNVEPTQPLNEIKLYSRNNYGKTEEFLLFASIFESNMIDKKYADKPLHYEISIGNDGIQEDDSNQDLTASTYEHFDDKSLYCANNSNNNNNNNCSEKQNLLSFVSQQYNYDMRSTTSPIRPVMTDRQYYHLPIEAEKPCLYLKSSLPDHRRRAYNCNIIEKIGLNLEIGLLDVQEMIRVEKPHPDRRLRGVLEELMIDCSRFLTISKGFGGSAIGKTKLDRERVLMCQREIETICNTSKNINQNTNENNIKDQVKHVNKILHNLKELAKDPQHSMPDIFIWLLCGDKRIAYQRLQTRHYLFSIVEEECGKSCAKLHNIFLKLSGKKNEIIDGLIQNMVYIYVWIGNKKHKKYFAKGLPKGYRMLDELENAEKSHLMPPNTIYYECKHSFELRAHIYQARSLFASDSSGLSDPFAKVILTDACQTTEVIEETLSPTWDQMLIFPNITLYGDRNDILTNPPVIVIEIYDRDNVGKAEFIGRAVARDSYIRFSDMKYSTPQLQWFDIWRGDESAGQLLACFELIQISSKHKSNSYPDILPNYKCSLTPSVNTGSVMYDNEIGIYPLPESIRPTLSKYRIEVLFWGLRDLKRVQFMSVDRPRVDIECAGNILQSSIILNYKKNPNFMIPVKHIDIELPDQEMYCPPLTIRVMDCRSFGRFVLVGTHMIASLSKYAIKDTTKELFSYKKQEVIIHTKHVGFSVELNAKVSKSHSKGSIKGFKNTTHESPDTYETDEEDNSDWWSRYFASVDITTHQNVSEMSAILDVFSDPKKSLHNSAHHFGVNSKLRKSTNKTTSPKKNKDKTPVQTKHTSNLIQIYSNELELCPQFDGFTEYLQSFELFRGKRYGNDSDDLSRLCGIFKGSLKLYRHPFSNSIFESRFTPSNEPINVLVRIYVVKGSDLHPADLNGKADPYIVINLGSKRVSDKDNYISKQLNPIFGKCFEFDATFPQDSMCTIQIYDWDLFGTDDLIGETKIDLENRFYSKHRATCGISRVYETCGPNQWRDSLKPSQILAKLCKDHKISGPVMSPQKVKLGLTTFRFGDTNNDVITQLPLISEEDMALAVLHNWKHITGDLVPEHIETRSVYHPDKPGIEQGKVEMWVDMFAKDGPAPPPAIDISPRKPKSYELRVIIWNTEDVLLEDDAFFTGEKMSDIYVKGWLKGPEDMQCTDIHYRSLTGEGNFNWRFVFPFEYLPAEDKIVISRKETVFSWDETECKIPARLFLQVWDADHFSADDFLGAITLDLNRFPRGAKTAKLCSLDMLKNDRSTPTVLVAFLWQQGQGRSRTPRTNIEAELQLLTKEEAERNPVGFGRGEPDPLERPNRPDSSFLWVLNPLKSIRYVVWHNYKWLLIKGLCFLLLVLLFALFVYSIPGYTVKKMIGA